MSKIPAIDFTLMFIKPDAIYFRKAESILSRSLASGFSIVARKEALQLPLEFIERFYAEHVGKPFFEKHAKFLGEGYCSAYLLRINRPGNLPAPETYRLVVGNTDPKKAMEDTLRQLFGTTLPRNAVHASDSVAAVKREAPFFFSSLELIQCGAGDLIT